MPIPEQQLQTWSTQGPTKQFTDTYDSVKLVLTDVNSPFYDKDFTVFLQGSYRNATNILGDSDVDVIIRLNKIAHIDNYFLPQEDKNRLAIANIGLDNSLNDFKKQVASWLYNQFGFHVSIGKKAIKIKSSGIRRDADVLVCAIARRYTRFKSSADQSSTDGIYFKHINGDQIINFPEQHTTNCTLKHQSTDQRFKRTVRVFKNLRNVLISSGIINSDLAPSYFIEGLLYNVPNSHFGSNEQTNFENIMKWLVNADKSKFVCANEHYFLFNDYSPVTWKLVNCERFINASIQLWNNFR